MTYETRLKTALEGALTLIPLPYPDWFQIQLDAVDQCTQTERKPMTPEEAVDLCECGGIQDCLQDPWDKLQNGSELSSIQYDMVRLIRAVEKFHKIG